MSRGHWTWRPTFREPLSKCNSSDQSVSVSRVEGRLVLSYRCKNIQLTKLRIFIFINELEIDQDGGSGTYLRSLRLCRHEGCWASPADWNTVYSMSGSVSVDENITRGFEQYNRAACNERKCTILHTHTKMTTYFCLGVRHVCKYSNYQLNAASLARGQQKY